MSRAVRLGLGRGAIEQVGPEAVFGFLQVDPRWDWLVDERAVFLARLIRDGGLPHGPVVDALDALGPDDDHDPDLLCEILGLLGEREALARQVRVGPYWEEALAVAQAGGYAGELREAATRRMLAEDRSFPWRGEPWQSWATDDPHVAARMVEPPQATSRPYADLPVEQLFGRLLIAMETAPWRRELRRRPADPIVLRYADHPLATRLITWIRRLDVEMVLPEARRWAVTVGHRLRRYALDLLAEHGNARDVPALAGGLRMLDDARTWCGYDLLLDGLARIGGDDAARVAEPYVRRLWFTPHTFERPSALRAGLAFPHDRLDLRLREGLRDCEERVRLIAVEHVQGDDFTREQLRYLADDPFETAAVRAAATARLHTDE